MATVSSSNSHIEILMLSYISPQSKGIIANLNSQGIAVSYNPKTRSTSCFVIGVCEHQIARCKRELRNMQSHAANPMLFPAIWLDVFAETRVRRSEGRGAAICEIQADTGLHWSVAASESESKMLDFNGLIYKLTVLGSELAWDEFSLGTLMNIQAKLMSAHQNFLALHESKIQFDCAEDKIGGRLGSTKDLLVGLQGRASYSVQQVNVQLQEVSYPYNLRTSVQTLKGPYSGRFTILSVSGTTASTWR